MTQKETLDIVFKFSALLVFAFLFNKSIENRPLAQFEGAFPLKGEQMFVMEMDNMGEVDLEEIIDIDGEDSARGLMKLLEKLEDLDDVQNVSANFNISDSLMEKVLGE